MNDTHMGMSVSIARKALDFQAGMAAAVINGSINKGQEMQQNLARSEGLAAQGIGLKLDIKI